ncbi:hypothetical protein [Ottowia sp.]|uniref:hypothetical protein n=1 Tax=Ottowia sp. TaxID=1898956 RepID=UPI002D09F839|nr:hypothetical protein [Ottowia sp.]HOB65872.1 hypothetical protein [Ottowia sp.]HPZ58706.1 hypothetical protein [Ottowia sp.]HQD47292.1 hypothetical protein [Ottowia sp.]
MASRSKPDALELARGNTRLEAAVLRSRKLLGRRALAAGVAGAVPLPGLDWAVDAAMLTQLLPKINAEFGLAPHQIAQLDAGEKERVQKAAAVVGSIIVGRLVTRDLVMRFARLLGKRLTVAQATRYVPIAGQLVSGALGYAALRYLGEQHIRDCVRVAQSAQLLLPAPAAAEPKKGWLKTSLGRKAPPEGTASA